MKKLYLLLSTAICLCFSYNASFAQNLQLRTNTYTLSENKVSNITELDYAEDEVVNDKIYRIIQFNEIPNKEKRDELVLSGFRLLDYLPKAAYYVEIDLNANFSVLSNFNVHAIAPIVNEYKLSQSLLDKKYPEWALTDNESIIMFAFSFAGISQELVQAQLESYQARSIVFYDKDLVQFEIPLNQLDQLYALPHFYYFEEMHAPEVPEDYQDVANHRTHLLNSPNATGLSYTGDGITIMVQDDGPIGPHIDYQGRTETFTSTNNGDHGDHVSGIIMGAGNLDPDGVGNAPGANLLVFNSSNGNYSSIQDLYDTANVVITSKSYGNGNNAGYTTIARMIDGQCWDNSALVHVFSAGNSGTSDFGYGAGAGWGNITGGHKQGKNVLAVGNLSDTDVLNSSSSRGPATDGRIKPDICAVGTNVYSTIDVNSYDYKTGTSMSCPGVSGSLAVLYEAYRDLNGGAYPNAALINAAVLNTADDLGNPGPDYQFGWGRLNTKKAFDLIAANNYQNGVIEEGMYNTHQIVVPDSLLELNVMVYWTDYRGSPNANPALVNDLNMQLTASDNNTYNPWILNPTPNPVTLDQDAVQGIDDLNNVEQITIQNPLAGSYSLNVEGFNVPQGPQEYFVVYQFVYDEIEVIYPVGGEGVNPSQAETIRWNATGDNGSFNIDFSCDGGTTWTNINNNLPGDWRSYPWNVPDTISDKALIRITRGTQVDESNAYFTIIDQPDNIQVEWACPNSFNISWDSIPGASGYKVYLLGEKYMDSVGYSIEANATIYANSNQTQWVSVKALGPNGGEGKRAIAVEKTPSTFGCTLDYPVAGFGSLCSTIGSGSCVKFIDMSLNAGQGAAWEWTFSGGNPSTSNLEHPVICYDTEGVYNVQLVVKNGVGEDTVSWNQYMNVVDGAPLPFMEDFEEMTLPLNWTYVNENTQTNWELKNGISAYGQGGRCIMLNNYDLGDIGGVSRFTTNQIDLSQSNFMNALTFDVAYAPTSNTDTLYVYATNDCGNTKELLFKAGGEELATQSSSSELFEPEAKQWTKKVVSLGNFTQSTSVSFIFENHSGQGNAVYVDNINIATSNDVFSTEIITAFPNPFQDIIQITGINEGESAYIQVSDAQGKVVFESEFTASGEVIDLNLGHLSDGMYAIRVQSDEKTLRTKFIKEKGN